MTTYRMAWVTITGKVFVSDAEIADALGLKGTEELTAVEQLVDVHPERIQVAFQDLANDKIHELYKTDDPMKMNEIDIDMTTFR